MPNDSTTGGYIVPGTPELDAYDATLEDIIQGALAGITGLAGNLVRPKWQPEPANQPDKSVDWCAFGLSLTDQDITHYEVHDPTAGTNGADRQERDEQWELLVMFYGPNSSKFMARLRDGLLLEQNRWTLYQNDLKVRYVGQPTNVPALLKESWVRRVDLRIQLARRVNRIYPIRDVASATVITNAEVITVTSQINP